MRKAGISDESIEAMSLRIYPLGFSSEEQYLEYKDNILSVLKEFEDSSSISNLRIIQQGSYVAGYSSNPRKGMRSIPTHIYNEESDLDFRLSGTGIKEYINSNDLHPEVKLYFPDLVEPDQLSVVFPQLEDCLETWRKKLGRGIQVTISMKLGPEFEPLPWDWEWKR